MADPPAPALRRVLRPGAPLVAHVAALALVLLALIPVVGAGASFSADEGATIVQARSLARGDGWIVDHPVPEVDPTGANYPLENSDRGANGVAPYAKHPLYPLLLAGADRVAGVPGMVVLSLAGTLAAAGLAALLARRLDPSLARPALWVVGLGSPLLFDGYLVVAHTLAAASAAGAVLLTVRAVEDRRPALALAVAPLVGGAVLLRTEAVFLAAGLVVAGLVVARRSAAGVVAALAAGAGLLAARAGEQAWLQAIVGRPVGSGNVALPNGGLAGRLRGLRLTWLTSGYGGLRPVDLALYAVLAAVLFGAWTVRRRPDEGRLVAACSVVAGAAALLAVAADPHNVVPGLLVAFPLLAAGLALVRRETLRPLTAQVATVAAAVFAAGVVATQYQRGGSGEWGGRYFALALPLVVPVAVAALRQGGRRIPPAARQVAAGSLVVCTFALSTMGLAGLRAAHHRNAALNAAVARLAPLGTAGGDGRPVVVAADGTLARLGWPTFDRARWLLAPQDATALAARLRSAGWDQFLFVARSPGDVARFGPAADVVAEAHGSEAGRTWAVLVVRSS